jgi:hypothetical protein
MKLLFIYDHKYTELWKDGLWAALELMKKYSWTVDYYNLQDKTQVAVDMTAYDFYLGWGAWKSPVDYFMQMMKGANSDVKLGLCIAGNSFPPQGMEKYDVLFYETEWYLPQIVDHPNVIHAFGVNTDIYQPIVDSVPVWDWTTVGAFSSWKRQEFILEKGGYKFAVGEIQKDNLHESWTIISHLLKNYCAVSDMVEPEYLNKIYNSSEKIYIPADINGGGERAVLEARAAGRPVEVEFDNPKLKELLKSPIWDHHYYFEQLKKGVESCIN